jgi:hypothetical protein
MSTTPTVAMNILPGLPPLQIVVEKETMQTAYRLHCSIFKMATEDFPVLLAPSESILPLEVLDRKYLVEFIISLY